MRLLIDDLDPVEGWKGKTKLSDNPSSEILKDVTLPVPPDRKKAEIKIQGENSLRYTAIRYLCIRYFLTSFQMP